MTVAIGARIVRGAAWSAVESWGRHLFNAAIIVILARQLGAEEFGLAALAMVMPAILAVPVINGVPDALVQRPHVDPMHLDSAFWLLVCVGLSLTTLIWLSAVPLAAMLHEPDLTELVRWTSIIVVLQSLGSVPGAVLKRELDFRLFALRTTAGTVVGGTLGIAMALSGYGVWSLVAMYIAKVTVESTILLGLGTWRPRMRFSMQHCRDLFPFSGPLVIQSLWTMINDELPKIVLGILGGTQAVGIFSFARRPLEFLTQGFLGPVSAVVMPAVARLQGDPERIQAFVVRAARTAALVGFPVFLGFAAVAPEAVPLMFGAHWAEAVPAIQILMLLGLERIVETLSGLSLLALGHSRLLLKLNVLYTGLCILMVSIGAHFSLEAALIGLVLCNLSLLPIFFYFAKRIGGIDMLAAMTTFPRLAICSTLMVVAIELSRQFAPAGDPTFMQLGIQIGVGGVAFLGAVVVLLPAEIRAAADIALRLRR